MSVSEYRKLDSDSHNQQFPPSMQMNQNPPHSALYPNINQENLMIPPLHFNQNRNKRSHKSTWICLLILLAVTTLYQILATIVAIDNDRGVMFFFSNVLISLILTILDTLCLIGSLFIFASSEKNKKSVKKAFVILCISYIFFAISYILFYLKTEYSASIGDNHYYYNFQVNWIDLSIHIILRVVVLVVAVIYLTKRLKDI